MAWLQTYISGSLQNWAHRKELLIDHTKIDSELTDFPILIHLNSSSGYNNADATNVFDHLAEVSGTLKIAVATVSGSEHVETYCEIDYWDWGNKEAWLWARIPTVSSGVDTKVYFYYDNRALDNTTYVGDVGDTPAQSVWDSAFVGVYHYAEHLYDGTISEVKDSTNTNHGHRVGAANTASSIIGRGLDITADDDSIVAEANVNTGDSWTAESFFKVPFQGTGVHTLFRSSSSDYMVAFDPTDGLLGSYIGAWRKSTFDMRTLANGWHYLSAVSDGSTTKFYIDGDFKDSINYYVTSGYHEFGGDASNSRAWGDLDETRVSNTNRSAAWVKATYYSNNDNLLKFPAQIYRAAGTVIENNVPVVRTVRMYQSSSGALVDEMMTTVSGTFELFSPFGNEPHYVVCMDDNTGYSYNHLIYGKIVPTVVSGTG